MEDESRTKKILRQLNEEIRREAGIIKGMTPDERWVVAVLVIIVGVIVLCVALLFSAAARAESFSITLTCPADKTKDICSLSRDEAKKIFQLIQHNNEVTKRLNEIESGWADTPKRCAPAKSISET